MSHSTIGGCHAETVHRGSGSLRRWSCLRFAVRGDQREGPREITIWEGLWSNASVSVANLAATPLYQEVMRRTGIDVTFIHPAQGQERESFNLMIASNDLPI